MRRRKVTNRYGIAFAILVGLCASTVARATAGNPTSELISCDRADEEVMISADARLDPSCTWTKGIKIVASDLTLDCQGARIASATRRYGIHIVSPTDQPLSNVTVRNCEIDGFLNCLHIEREGFRELAEGEEYEDTFSNILIEDSRILNSRGVGIFVNGYVTDVTLRRLHVEGTGSAGIYLETGSTDTLVEDCMIVNNGYRENGPNGQFFELAGTSFYFWGPGREGIAVDGARNNIIRNNYFSGNSAGSILLYKNCGEYPERDRYFERRYGAHNNVIEGNTFDGGDNGVWIGSRMGENTTPMECTDPQYTAGYVLDYAEDNVVRSNTFENVTYAIRVEDDRAVIEDNQIVSDDPAHIAVLVGTPLRTSVLGRPVDGTRIAGNRADIADNPTPYRWIHGHSNTTFANNRGATGAVGFCEGEPAARGPFVMSIAFVAADPGDPPTGEPPTLAPPQPLSPCPICEGDCDADGAVTIDELVRGIKIAMGGTAIEECALADRDDDGAVSVDELTAAVGRALEGCE